MTARMSPRWWLLSALVLLGFLLIPPPPDGIMPPFVRAHAGVAPFAAGVHAPNRPWRETDFTRMAAGHFGTVKMMSYHPPEAYARLKRDNPQLQFVVRLDTPWNELPPPDAFAAAQAERLRPLAAAGYDLWVEIGNEPNLELHPQAEASYVSWYLAVLKRLRAAVPRARYGFPGLAQDRREASWLAADRPAIEASDWLAVHAYWTSEREMLDPRRALKLIGVHNAFPRLPILVTEAGNDAAAPPAVRAQQYARFTRTLEVLPYVRAVHFFILSGTPEWQSFFFNDQMVQAVRDATQEPTPVLAGLADLGSVTRAAAQQLLPWRAIASQVNGVQTTPSTTPPIPTPPPSGRRVLLQAPGPLDADAPGSRWMPLPPLAQDEVPAALRSASTYLGTHFSVRFELAPPEPGVPMAVQFASADAVDPLAPETGRTGFALLWDGAAWRLQYRRDGALATDAPLAGVVPNADGWCQAEVALEPRSAAAWVWAKGAPQPAAPNAVFAPPEAAAGDGAFPRALFFSAHPVANVRLEGATRD